MPRQKINERGEKTASPGIILSKRKGGIRAYKALNRPRNDILFWSPRDPLLGPDQDSPKVGHIQGLGSFLLFLAPLNDH